MAIWLPPIKIVQPAPHVLGEPKPTPLGFGCDVHISRWVPKGAAYRMSGTLVFHDSDDARDAAEHPERWVSTNKGLSRERDHGEEGGQSDQAQG